MKRTARTRHLLSSTDSSGNGVSHGQISYQEHPVADALENRWNVDHRVPSGFGAVGAGSKNGYAGISGKPVTLILEVSLPICGLCGTGFTLPASRHWPGNSRRCSSSVRARSVRPRWPELPFRRRRGQGTISEFGNTAGGIPSSRPGILVGWGPWIPA